MEHDRTTQRTNRLHRIAELVQHPEPQPQIRPYPLRRARAAARQSELEASTALPAQRPHEPCGTGVRREAYADLGIALGRKRPIERCMHVVALRQVNRVPAYFGDPEPFLECTL